MKHEVYPSIEAMLSPDTLSALSGRPVENIRLGPFHSVDGLSGGKLFWVDTDGVDGRRYVLKRFTYASDWVMRVTGDERARAVLCWESGLLDRLPGEIAHEVIACARDEDGWAVLLNDVSGAMVPPGDDPISAEENSTLLEAMASLNAAFWGDAELADPAQGFCSLSQRYSAFAPHVVRPVAEGRDPIPPVVLEGWEAFPALVAADIASLVGGLLEDSAPLCGALLRYPQTVVHGDWKLGNIGLHSTVPPRVVLLDWALVGPAPPAVELAWYLAVNCARLPVSKEEAIGSYRSALQGRLGGRFEESWWRPQLELALLGAFVQLGWPKAWGAVRGDERRQARERAELAWWSDRAREGARWLSSRRGSSGTGVAS